MQEESLQATVMSPSSNKQEIKGFGMSSDEGMLRTLVGGHGITGRTQGWEKRGPLSSRGHDMIVRQRAQLGGICGWVAVAFPQLL